MTLKAEVFDTEGLSVKAVAQLTRQAQAQGPAVAASAPQEVDRSMIFSADDDSSGGCREVSK